MLQTPAVSKIAFRSSRGNEALIFLKERLSLLTSAATPITADSLDFSRDGIGDVEDVAVCTGKAVVALAQRQTAQPRAAHLAFADLRERRGVGARHVIATQRIRRAFEERHHGPALVVGFLDEDLPETVDDQAPDVARPPADDLKPFTVRGEAGELRLVVVGDFAHAALHF